MVVSLLYIFERRDMMNKTAENLGADFIRSAVIILMESIPELDKLQNEDWFNAEDRITALIKEIIKENEHG